MNMSMQSKSSVDSESSGEAASKMPGKNSNKIERKYYHVQISKLANAFEKQFFSSI